MKKPPRFEGKLTRATQLGQVHHTLNDHHPHPSITLTTVIATNPSRARNLESGLTLAAVIHPLRHTPALPVCSPVTGSGNFR